MFIRTGSVLLSEAKNLAVDGPKREILRRG
jgi:hypothetical protein